MNRFLSLGLAWLCLTLSACQGGIDIPDDPQGGSEFGNPRLVLGSVQMIDANEAPLSQVHIASVQQLMVCAADQVILIDSQGVENTTTLDGSCSFELNAESAKAYRMEFARNNERIATLFVSEEGEFPNTVFFLSEDPAGMALGEIVIEGLQARAENNPLFQNDQDADGIVDGLDDDDDGDGLLDSEEIDCDLDAFIDDVDEDSMCSEIEPVATVLSVSPFAGQQGVSSAAPIILRFDCSLDNGVFYPSAIIARQQPDDVITELFCELSEENTVVSCMSSMPFAAETVYEIEMLKDLTCQNADADKVPARIWTFMTGP